MIWIVGMTLTYMKALMKRATQSVKMIIYRIINGPMRLHSHLLGDWLRVAKLRHAKCHTHRDQKLCKIFRACVNFVTKHTVFCHKFNWWDEFCSVCWGKRYRKCRIKVFL